MRYYVAGIVVLVSIAFSSVCYTQEANPFDEGDSQSEPFADGESEPDPFGDESNPKGRVGKKADKKQAAKMLIRNSLAKKVSCDFFEEPLADAMEQFAEEHGYQCYTNKNACEAAGIDPDTSVVTLQLNDVSLGAILELMLEEFDLSYVVNEAENLLEITSVEEAESQLSVRVYTVHNLLEKSDPNGSADMLIDTIVTAVYPESWDELGGVGSISHYQGTLVVSQTRETHDGVVELLSKLGTAILAAGGPKIPVPKPIHVQPQQNADVSAEGGGFF